MNESSKRDWRRWILGRKIAHLRKLLDLRIQEILSCIKTFHKIYQIMKGFYNQAQGGIKI